MIWIACDSKNDLNARVIDMKGKAFEFIEQEDSNVWGILALDEDGDVIPLGYPNLGLKPEVIRSGSLICVGIASEVIVYSSETKTVVFRYKVPTVFHEFIEAKETEIVFQDETGFIALSSDGEVLWSKFFDDIVGTYDINDGVISGKTECGDKFEFQLEQNNKTKVKA